jgi:hypothetical protein
LWDGRRRGPKVVHRARGYERAEPFAAARRGASRAADPAA